MYKNIIFSMMFVFNSLLANSLGLSDSGNGEWDVTYSSSEIIAGFQFNVDGATINSASGGDATTNGFLISASGTTALGFSLIVLAALGFSLVVFTFRIAFFLRLNF